MSITNILDIKSKTTRNYSKSKRIKKQGKLFDWIKSKDGGKKGVVIANTGAGKTLAVVLYCYYLLENNPKLIVHANFHINLPRCVYNPYMFFDFNKLEDAVLVFDDCSNASTLKRYSAACANISRKANIILIFIGQREKMVDKSLRDITDFRIYVKLKRNKKDLYCYMFWEDKTRRVAYKDIKKWLDTHKFNNKKIYDTKEKVVQILDDDAIDEIIRISKTRKDIKRNLFLLSGSKADRKTYFNDIMKKMKKYSKDPQTNEQNNDLNTAVLTGIGLSLRDIKLIKKNSLSTLSESNNKEIDNAISIIKNSSDIDINDKIKLLDKISRKTGKNIDFKIKSEEIDVLDIKTNGNKKEKELTNEDIHNTLNHIKCTSCNEFSYSCQIAKDFGCVKFKGKK